MFTREIVSSLFQTSDICTVTFTKKDGTERVMRCTTKPNLIPEDQQPARAAQLQPVPDNQYRVYDVDSEGWRSFLIPSIKEIRTGKGLIVLA